jgi:hypothetical protein
MPVAVIGSDAYKWLLTFHILLAVVWVGSNTAIQIFVIRATRASADKLAYLASEIEWYGTRILLPTSLTLVLLGFLRRGARSRGRRVSAQVRPDLPDLADRAAPADPGRARHDRQTRPLRPAG